MPEETRSPDRPIGPMLGLDLGQSRIGIAVSDPDARLAVPLGTVRTGAPQDVRAIAKLVADYGVVGVVVGLPVSMSGREGESATLARTFAEALRGFLHLPVVLQDERLSTVQAERSLAAAGMRGRARRDVADQHAAAIILQAYLDRIR